MLSAASPFERISCNLLRNGANVTGWKSVVSLPRGESVSSGRESLMPFSSASVWFVDIPCAKRSMLPSERRRVLCLRGRAVAGLFRAVFDRMSVRNVKSGSRGHIFSPILVKLLSSFYRLCIDFDGRFSNLFQGLQLL